MTKLRRRIVSVLDVPLREREIAEFVGVPLSRLADPLRALAEREEIERDGPYWVRAEEAP